MTNPPPRLERGHLLIADLTGYTAYLAGSDPEHAPVIAGDFIETVVARLRDRFELMKLEGDAAFMWAPIGSVDGSQLLDAVDAAYFAFQRRLRSLTQATECECEACRRMPQLDLKFVAHVGDALRQRIAGHEELAGRDVIVAHRLLKGTGTGRAGARNYVLFTAAAVTTLGLDADALHMTSLTEQYDELGTVNAFLLDLGRRWASEERREGRARPSGRLIGRVERLLPAPPIQAWEHLTAPGRRTGWEGLATIEESVDGMRGVGSTSACVAGRLTMVEEILDWRPFETFARRVDHPELGAVTAVHRLREVATGTLLEVAWFSAAGPPAPVGARYVAERSAALDRLAMALERAHLAQAPMA